DPLGSPIDPFFQDLTDLAYDPVNDRLLAGLGNAHHPLTAGGTFAADEVLAKHDENYMPPEVAEALKASGKLGQPHPAGRSAGRQP
ncbi:MAG: cytochrome c maturation protein CcmE, partial [Pseudomonadota bacterium]